MYIERQRVWNFGTKKRERKRINPTAIFYFPLVCRRGYFNGCVKNIKYGFNEQSLKTIQDIKGLRYFVKDGCDLTYCHKPEPVCKNQGKCSPIDGKIKVECDCRWTGFEGTNCTVGK